MKGSNYSLKLLKETSNTEDLFEDQTHQRVADTLFNVVNDDSTEAITIGLEGGWGGGKSTIVSLLKKRIVSDNSKIRYFYFDAWAHEGDPLRRIFLEEMIDQLTNHENSAFLDLKEKLGKRKKETKTKTSKTLTKFGILFTLSSLFIPFGVAIVSGTVSEVVFKWTGRIHWMFLIGMALALAPFSVAACNIFSIIRAKKKVWDTRRWMFLHGESTAEETNEMSEEEERSSVEFEKYFKEIIDSILTDKQHKLLIVIDNLDRISRDDSLKIWSTLQTFLQRRNPSDEKYDLFDRVWTLVPYDEIGLGKLWGNSSASFFDKCFQLRLQAPRMLVSGWEVFCRSCMDTALLGWSNEEIEKALRIFRWYRKTVSDSPSPREIKMFINQVGILRIHVNASVGIEAIACFVVEKYLKGTSIVNMEDGLISGSYPTQPLLSLFNSDNIQAEISAILFGVAPEKGQQLLLMPHITNALRDVSIKELVKLCEIHQKAFWIVFNLLTKRIQRMSEASSYCIAVEKGLLTKYRKDCAPFISRLSSLVRDVSPDNSSFLRRGMVDNYLSYARLLVAETGSVKQFYIWLGEAFTRESMSDTFDPTLALRALHEFDEISGGTALFNIIGDSWQVGFWSKIAVVSNEENLNSHDYLIPPEEFPEKISEELIKADFSSSEMHELIKYSIRAGIESWSSIETALNRMVSIDLLSTNTDLKSLLSIMDLIVGYPSESNLLVGMLSAQRFWMIMYNADREDKFLAMLIAIRLIPTKFESIDVSNREAKVALGVARSFLKQANADIQLLAWNRLKSCSDFNFLWTLSSNPDNKFIGSLIDKALEVGNSNLFNSVDDAFDSYFNSFKLVSDENRETLANSFLSFTDINDKLRNTAFASLSDDVSPVYAQLLVRKSDAFNNRISNELIHYKEAQWVTVLEKNTDELSIIGYLKSQECDVNLGRSYYEACVRVSKDWLAPKAKINGSKPLFLKQYVSNMSPEFIEHYRMFLSDYVVEQEFLISDLMKSLFVDILDSNKVFFNGKTALERVVELAFNTLDYKMLRFLSNVLSKDASDLFKPASRMSIVLIDPFYKALENAKDDVDVKAVKHLAKKFKVNWKARN